MLIKDPSGVYELKVDKARRIVYEKLVGSVDADIFKRFDEDYRTKVVPYLGAGNWMKLSDLRNNKPNTKVTPEMINGHLSFLKNKGCQGGACLVDSATLKMQLNRAGRSSLEPEYFDNEGDADKWLKSKGY